MEEMHPDLTRDEFDSILHSHTGNDALRRALESSSSRGLFRVMGRYIYFNSVFGGGVANLAGEIAVRQKMFSDSSEKIVAIQDRSVAIAADIFAAAVDEFGDSTMKNRFTHRALAQATLRGMAQYFGFSPKESDLIVKSNQATEEAVLQVKKGYLLNMEFTDKGILKAIGFHMSSEILADIEFNLVDNFLRSRHLELVMYLRKTRVAIGDFGLPAYAWVQIHTAVEADHFDFAIKSANSALRYYCGTLGKETAKSLMIEGFREFANVQSSFMEHIAED